MGSEIVLLVFDAVKHVDQSLRFRLVLQIDQNLTERLIHCSFVSLCLSLCKDVVVQLLEVVGKFYELLNWCKEFKFAKPDTNVPAVAET